jgi:hypothetical protein
LTWYALPVPHFLSVYALQSDLPCRICPLLEGGHTLHTVGLLDILGLCNGFLVTVVPDGYVCSSFGERVCHCQANASSCTRDDSCAFFEGEEWEDTVRDWSNGVIMGEIPTSHGAVHLERCCIGSTRQRSCRGTCRPSQIFKLKLYSKESMERRDEPLYRGKTLRNCETNNQGWTRHPDKLLPVQGISRGKRHASLFPFARSRGIESRKASGPMPPNRGKLDGGVRGADAGRRVGGVTPFRECAGD